MRKVLLPFVAFFLCSQVHAQFQLNWQKSFGGTADDWSTCVKPTTDGGYIVCGYTYSNNGDVTFNHSTTAADAWVLKLDSLGNIQWQKSYGGTFYDAAYEIIQTSDGGYAFVGEAASNNGDVSGNHNSNGSDADIWFVKLTSTGTIQWQKCLGGTLNESGNTVYQTPDGDYMIGGTTGSSDGNVTGQHGNNDYWLVKLNSTGSLLWQKTYGGTADDRLHAIIPGNDGGFMLAGRTYSNNGDATYNHGNSDYWLVKIDVNGVLLWQKTYGGSSDELTAPSITSTNSLDGYVLSGNTYSTNGDVIGNHGSPDLWLVRVNNTGNVVWKKCYGGSSGDTNASVCKTTGGYIVFGRTSSTNGDVTSVQGAVDWWLFKIDENGTIKWRKTLGGPASDYSAWMAPLPNNKFIAAGMNMGNGGDVTGNQGAADYWMVKFSSGSAAGLSTTATVGNTALCCKATVDLTASGGTAPYTYLWSDGKTTQDLTFVCTGTYVVTISDAATMVIVDTVDVTTANGPVISSAVVTPPGCPGNTGSIDITVTGNVTPYSYIWSNLATTQDISGLAAGTYTVNVYGNGGCMTTKSFTFQETLLSSVPTLTGVQASCGLSNGSVTAVVNSGLAPYTFLWSTGATTQTLANKPAGYYAVTVTNGSDCTGTGNFSIPNYLGPTVSNTNTNASCGMNNGAITLAVTGGTSPYSYVWSNGATTQNLVNIGAGTYIVTVTGTNGCKTAKAITLSGTPALAVTLVPHASTCGLNNGYISVVANFFAGPLTYSWSNGATTSNITNKNSGTYSVTVTFAPGCTASGTATIPGSTAASVSLATVNPSCGSNNGTITATPSGSVAPYLFSWNTSATTQNLTNLPSGNYTVTLTAANTCTAASTATLTATGSPTVTSSVTNASCGNANGAIQLNVSGGTTPYTYLWSNGKTTQNISNLAAGSYTVTVTGANGCNATSTSTVTASAGLTLSLMPQSPTCGSANGSITLTVSGGTSPYTYLWSNGKTTQNISGLNAGTYSVTVGSAGGCSTTGSTNLISPNGPTVSLTTTNPSCGVANGAVNATVTGGTAPYTYLWSNGKTTQNISALNSGTYSITVTASNACTATASATIASPNSPVVTLSSTNPSCSLSNGTVSSTVSGGVAPYSYLWSNGSTTSNITGLSAGTYTVTVTGANGCATTQSKTLTSGTPTITFSVTNPLCNSLGSINATITGGTPPYTYIWNNAKTTEDITSLSNGTYTLTVTSADGCSATQTATLNGPAGISLYSWAITPAGCGLSNGSIDISVNSGTPPYTYLWSNGKTTQDVSNLAPATYTVSITSSNGCSTAQQITITEELSVNATVTNATCNSNGSIAITSVTGGTSPYTFLWSNGKTTQNITNLAPNVNYYVTVTSANGCTGTLSEWVLDDGPWVSVNGSHPTCTQINGSVYASAPTYFGTPPFTYVWNTGATVTSLSNLPSGTYTITLTDANGCTATDYKTLVAGPLPAYISYNLTNSLCQNTPATLAAQPAGAASYLWSSGQTTTTIQAAAYGAYSVTVTNSAGCSGAHTVTLAAVSSTNDYVYGNYALCSGGYDTLLVSSYGGPFTSYQWSTGSTTGTTIVNAPGNYNVTTTTIGGCTYNSHGYVAAGTAPVVILDSLFDAALCYSNYYYDPDTIPGQINVHTEYDYTYGNYYYQWSDNAIQDYYYYSPYQVGGNPGIYTLTVTTSGGCSSVETYEIGLNQGPSLSSWYYTDPATCDQNSGAIYIYAEGGTPPYYYSWYNYNTWEYTSDTISVIDSLAAGTYDITISDYLGCAQYLSVTIESGATFEIYGDTIKKATCGLNNGGIDIEVYDYNWPPVNSTYLFLWNNGVTSEDLENANPNLSYTVTVTNDEGCTWSAYFDPVGSVTPPAVSISTASATCSPMNVQYTASGSAGTAPYSYIWSNAATTQTFTGPGFIPYTVTLTDASGCTSTKSITLYGVPPVAVSITGDVTICPGASTTLGVNGVYNSYLWSNGSTNATITVSAVGNFSVTVTNATGCSGVASATLVQNTLPQFWLTVPAHPSCGLNNGAIYFNYTSGNTPFTYAWSNGKTISNLSNLAAGTYTLTLTDAQGCTATGSTTLIATPGLDLTHTVTPAYCNVNNGLITVFISNAVYPVSYVWSNGKTTQSISNLAPGTYNLTATTGTGCSATKSIVVPSSPNLKVEAVGFPPTCSGTNGYVYVNQITGASNPYSYNWSTGTTAYVNYNLVPGIYSVTVTHANGCTGTDTALIKPYIPHTVTITPSSAAICIGQSVNLQASGAVSYQWTPSTGLSASTGASVVATPTVTTTYIVAGYKVSCAVYDTVVVTVNPLPNVVVTSGTSSPCSGGSSTLTASGASTYYWTPSTGLSATTGVSVTASPAIATTYTVVGVSSAGCFKTASMALGIGSPPALTKSITHTTCGLANGAINLSVSGSTPPYTYAWSNGATTEDLSGRTAGTYSVTVTASGGCTASTSAVINSSTGVTVSSTSVAAGCGQANGSITLTVSGAVSPYSFLWSNGKTTQNITNLVAGNYTVTVTAANGCTRTKITTVSPSSGCGIPTNVSLTNVTNNSANVSWTGTPCAVQYRVWIKATNVTSAASYLVNAPITTYTFINLLPTTTYEVKVRSICSVDGTLMSAYTTSTMFTTGANPPCTIPVNLSASAVSNTSALISWTPTTGSYGYNLQYKKSSLSIWSNVYINNGATSSYTIAGLTPNTAYQFKIRNKCNGSPATWSAFSPIATLTTPVRLDEGDVLHDVTLYPNPSTGNFTLKLVSTYHQNALVRIHSADGRLLTKHAVDLVSGDNTIPFEAYDWPAGIYMIEVKTDEQWILRKLILQH